jgi:hypothetical protein
MTAARAEITPNANIAARISESAAMSMGGHFTRFPSRRLVPCVVDVGGIITGAVRRAGERQHSTMRVAAGEIGYPLLAI